MLELYLPLMIAKLFSLNGLFIILSCGSAWAPLFALMVLFDLLYLLGHKIEHYHYHELWFAYCNTCTLTWSLLKLENGMKKHITNVDEIKYEFAKLVAIFLLLIKCWSLIVFLTCPNRVLSESLLQSCPHVKELLSQNPLYI